MALAFWKMHGLGNDFILFDSIKTGYVPRQARIKSLCDRHFGIGADQILVILDSKKADYRMRIFNADGSEAEMCGNGIRCAAKYISVKRKSSRKKIEIETLGGIMCPEIRGAGVRVNMGKPSFNPEKVPFNMTRPAVGRRFEVDGNMFDITVLSMGNPHCVIPVDFVDGVPIESIGPMIEKHPVFPNGVNVEFVQILDRTNITVRVWERGVGETLACGTGASAAVVACAKNGLIERKVTVQMQGGKLKIEWQKKTDTVFMTGPAEFVFRGTIDA